MYNSKIHVLYLSVLSTFKEQMCFPESFGKQKKDWMSRIPCFHEILLMGKKHCHFFSWNQSTINNRYGGTSRRIVLSWFLDKNFVKSISRHNFQGVISWKKWTNWLTKIAYEIIFREIKTTKEANLCFHEFSQMIRNLKI